MIIDGRAQVGIRIKKKFFRDAGLRLVIGLIDHNIREIDHNGSSIDKRRWRVVGSVRDSA